MYKWLKKLYELVEKTSGKLNKSNIVDYIKRSEKL